MIRFLREFVDSESERNTQDFTQEILNTWFKQVDLNKKIIHAFDEKNGVQIVKNPETSFHVGHSKPSK